MKKQVDIKVAELINSLGIVIIPMLLVMIGFMVHTSYLIKSILPTTMSDVISDVTSAFLGFSVGITLLTTAVNSSILPAWADDKEWFGFPFLFALCAVVINIFFFEVEFSMSSKNLQKVFICSLLGLIDYLFAYLFVNKYDEKRNELLAKQENEDWKRKHEQLTATHEQRIATNKQLHATVEQLQTTIKQQQPLVESLTCEYCSNVFTPSGIKSHRSRCGKKNQKVES